MRLLPFLIKLVTSTLVLTGIRSPPAGELRKTMLRDSGDLWNPAEPGSNIIPCGEWGPLAQRLQVPLGGSFVLEGSIPVAKGGGVLTVDGIFDPNPNFNLAGRLYPSTRFNVTDIADQPTNFSEVLTLPATAQPGPFTLQIKYVSLDAKYAYFQCADLEGFDPNATSKWTAISWWIAAIVILAVGVIIAGCSYCVCCKRCEKRKKHDGFTDRGFAEPAADERDHGEVSVKNPHADREASESMEIEDMAHSESSDDEPDPKVRR